MEKLYVALVLAVIIGIAGCVQEEKKEPPAADNNTSAKEPPIIEKNITVEEPQSPTLLNEKLIGHGRYSALISSGETLHIAYQRYTGSEDIYHATYKEGVISTSEVVANEVTDEISPSFAIYNGNIYLFYTRTAGAQASNMPFKVLDGGTWSKINDGPSIYEIWYPHNQSTLYHKKKILLFWARGMPNERGNIGAQYYDGSSWIDAIKVSAENVDERNPKVNSTNLDIHLIYDGYAANGDSNEVYYRLHNGFEWSSAEKISGSVKENFKSSGAIIVRDEIILALWFAKGKLYLSIKEGAEWSDPIVLISEETVQEPAIAVHQGKLLVSYTKWKENVPYVYLAELKGV